MRVISNNIHACVQAANASRYWPTGRGIFHNEEKTFLVWVGEEDHLRIISMAPGGDVGRVFQLLIDGIEHMVARAIATLIYVPCAFSSRTPWCRSHQMRDLDGSHFARQIWAPPSGLHFEIVRAHLITRTTGRLCTSSCLSWHEEGWRPCRKWLTNGNSKYCAPCFERHASLIIEWNTSYHKVRGSAGEHSEAEGGKYDISNRWRSIWVSFCRAGKMAV